MSMRNINILLVLGCMLSLIASHTVLRGNEGTDSLSWIEWESPSVQYSVTRAHARQTFGLDFGTKSIPRYIKVTVTTDTDVPTPIVYFSGSDANVQNDRAQMVKSVNEKTATLWLKKEEFSEGDLYLAVECVTSAQCDYTLEFTGDDYMVFDPNFVYSFVVGANNKELMIRAKVDPDATNVVLYAFGSSKITQFTVSGASPSIRKYPTGSACIFKQENVENSSEYDITLKVSDAGEFITIGGYAFKDESAIDSKLVPNAEPVSGLLDKSYSANPQCHNLSILSKDPYKSAAKVFITGHLHNRMGIVYLKDKAEAEIEGSRAMVRNGLYSYAYSGSDKEVYLCVALPTEDSTMDVSEIPYTFSISEPTSLKSSAFNYYDPQEKGKIYRRLIPKGSYAFFSGTNVDTSAKKIDYNMFALKGVPKMYFATCTDYPHCQYTDSEAKSLKNPKATNRFTTYSVAADTIKDTTLSASKNVIVVKCLDDDPNYTGYCEFETSITCSKDSVQLIEGQQFSAYTLAADKGTYVVDVTGEKNIRRINIEITVLSGDVSFSLKDTSITSYKYYLSNKVYFLINQEDNDDLYKIELEFSATLNSFYIVEYSINRRGEQSLYEAVVPSGLSTLVQIDPTAYLKTKKVYITNLRTKDKNPFLVNFFALNCDFSVKRGDTDISFSDGYAQEVLTSTTSGYGDTFYEYDVTIEEPDPSNYNHKMCMLYVAAVEQKANDIDYDREIITSENIGQQMIFENGIKKLRFNYPHSDKSKDLVLYVNVIDLSNYRLTLYADNEKITQYEVTRSKIIHIPASDFESKCADNNVCNIVMEVELYQNLIQTNPMIELTMRQILNVPSYLQKGRAKKDFVCGDKLYYLYTDVGKNQVGEVLVDFIRGSGKIYGKVVRKDRTDPEEECNWRGIYRMPSADWEDSVEYDPFIKKLKISSEDTADCIEGCYLLITIQLDLTDDYADFTKFYPFSILTRLNAIDSAYTDIPKVVIQVDEYIIGNVAKAENERISQFYEVWLPHDSDTVQFDWQSSVAGLYINLGGIRSTAKNPDFKLVPSGKDGVLTLTKQQILDRCNIKQIKPKYADSLQDLNLVIGIWTDKIDSYDTELYSLRVHEPLTGSGELDITEVAGDHKTLCKASLLDGLYSCLFMVTLDEQQIVNGLLVHGSSEDKSATSYIYAKYIEKSIYDEFDLKQLNNNLPSSIGAEYNSKKDGVDYIYIQSVDKSKYLFVNVIADRPTDIKLLVSYYTFNTVLTPNPSGEQVFSVTGDHLNLKFATTRDIMVNIVTLGGEGEVYWANDASDKYILRGSSDRLSLTSGNDYANNKQQELVIKNTKYSANANMNDPGFAFYIWYETRDSENNVDEILYGKSLEMAYKTENFPIYLFSKVLDSTHDVNVAFTFHNLDLSQKLYHEQPLFRVSSSLIKEATAYNAKVNSDIVPLSEKSLVGTFDLAINTAQISFTKEDLQNFNVKEADNPTLYIQIQSTSLNFTGFSLEAQVSKSNDGVSPIPKVYHYGRIGPDTECHSYKLRVDKNNRIMRVSYSTNGEVEFYVSLKENDKTNVSGLEPKDFNGKTYVTLTTSDTAEYYYLNIYKKKTGLDKRLYNYVFKYVNAAAESDFRDYPIKTNADLILKENKNADNTTNVSVTFNKIDKENVKVNYFLRVVSNSTHVYNEKYQTIALMESPAVVKVSPNPTITGDTLTIEAFNVPKDYVYIQVVAQILDETIVEYNCYNGIHVVRPYVAPEGSNDGVDTVVFIVVGGILLALVIGLVIAVIIFKNKNKSLLNQVKHVSFQKTNSNTDPNLLLNKQQQQQAPAEPQGESQA